MSAASNSAECLRELSGRTIVGILQDAMPPHRPDLAQGTKTLVLDDGTGFTFTRNGAFWRETSDNIDRAIRREKQRLADAIGETAELLKLAGAKP
jgi:hypothetical protein